MTSPPPLSEDAIRGRAPTLRECMEVTPDDVLSVLASARLVFILSSLNAVVFSLAAQRNESVFVVLGWYVATQWLFAWVYLRSHAALRRGFKKSTISARAMRRLKLMAAIQASPWAIAAAMFFGRGSAQMDLVVALVCAGMSIAGAMWSHRVVPAALTYCFTIIASLILTAILRDLSAYWPIVAYGASLSVLMVFVVTTTAHAVKQRDVLLNAFSTKNEALKTAQDRILSLANEDALTGLPNRKALLHRVDDEIAAAEPGATFALLMTDLDRFKNVNDTHGHQMGDRLLQRIGERLKGAVREREFVARLGGDEFAIFLKDVRSDRDAMKVAKKVRREIARAVELNGHVLHPDGSVGLAMFPEDGAAAAELLVSADIALHKAKDAGKGRIAAYSADMAEEVAQADALETNLRVALAMGGLELRYQPKVDMKTRQIIGAEALLRWSPPGSAPIPPPVFLQVAEERGLILEITSFVFAQVAADLQKLRALGLPATPIAINIHPVDLKNANQLFARLEKLEGTGATTADFLFEITEGCVVGRGSDEATKTLQQLHRLGVRFSLDDFGTGHASLSHLKSLPVDELKIDKEFVSGLITNAADRAIVTSAIALTREMGLTCVAEGVETEVQLDALNALGCDVAQGYLFAPALGIDAFVAMLKDQDVAANAA